MKSILDLKAEFKKRDLKLNECIESIEELNDLPFPDRQVLYDADPNLAAIGAKSFVSARGCPYKCSYCFNKQYNDNYKGLVKILRVRSPELVIIEINT
jgi:pyruvate-formate lyase-activating enzyme